jgi:hypothetical protein
VGQHGHVEAHVELAGRRDQGPGLAQCKSVRGQASGPRRLRLKFPAINNDPGTGKMATYSRFQAGQVTREQSCPFYILNLQQLCYKTF